MKRRRLVNDIAASLKYFCKSIHKNEELKLEAIVKMYEINRKFELEMFKLT